MPHAASAALAHRAGGHSPASAGLSGRSRQVVPLAFVRISVGVRVTGRALSHQVDPGENLGDEDPTPL